MTSVFETVGVDRVWLLFSLVDAIHQTHAGQNGPRPQGHFHLWNVEDHKHTDLPLVSVRTHTDTHRYQRECFSSMYVICVCVCVCL